MTDHDKLLARMDTWLGTGDSDTADFLCDMRDAAAAIRDLQEQLARHDATIDAGVRENASLRVQLEDERKARAQAKQWHVDASTNAHMHYTNSVQWKQRAEAAEAALAAIEAVLKECQRIPGMPFPDPGAHSWQAYGTAVFRAWSQIRQKIDIALKPTAAAQDNKARTSRDEFKAHSSVSLPNTPGPAPAAAHDEIARRWRNGS